MCGEEWRMEKNGDIILETSHLIFVMKKKKCIECFQNVRNKYKTKNSFLKVLF